MKRLLPLALLLFAVAGFALVAAMPADCYVGLTIGRVLKLSGC